VPWQGLGRALPASASAGDDETMVTDLSVLVDAIRQAGATLGIAEQHSPWLPPLPDIVTLDELPGAGSPAGAAAGNPAGEVPLLPFGLTDVPARQSREPLTFDLAHGGHMVVAGAAHTGRSTLLRTLAGSLAASASPADAHIYAIDCGTGAMLPLTALPHCGAVVTRDQTERMERLLGKLRGEIGRRQQILASDGFAGLAEQRAASADPLPWMLLLLDWWEGFVAAFDQYDYGRLIDSLLQILREGAAVGLRAVVTTDRSALIGQVGTVFARRMVLRMTDRADAAWAGVNERSVPAHQPPGRVMFEGTPHPFEAQIAMLDPSPSGAAQVSALRRLAEQAAGRWERPLQPLRPLRVDPLPPRITVDETWKLDPDFAPPSPLWALAGAGGDELAPQGIDVRDEGPGVVVAGPPRSGRSTTLMTMARSLLARQTPVILVTPRRSPLRSLDGQDGVLGVFGADADPAALQSAAEGQERYVVLVDDAELLFNAPVSDPLEKIIVSGRDADHGVIVAGSTPDFARAFSGFIPAALRSRCGILVSVESPSDGDVFGVRLPRNAGAGPAGRGLLIKAGTVAPVQLAISE
jgi:S-DNA-T family DNA segregation ATPase FtsK/SpoIIIE